MSKHQFTDIRVAIEPDNPALTAGSAPMYARQTALPKK